jgi:hypothetical protein
MVPSSDRTVRRLGGLRGARGDSHEMQKTRAGGDVGCGKQITGG